MQPRSARQLSPKELISQNLEKHVLADLSMIEKEISFPLSSENKLSPAEILDLVQGKDLYKLKSIEAAEDGSFNLKLAVSQGFFKKYTKEVAENWLERLKKKCGESPYSNSFSWKIWFSGSVDLDNNPALDLLKKRCGEIGYGVDLVMGFLSDDVGRGLIAVSKSKRERVKGPKRAPDLNINGPMRSGVIKDNKPIVGYTGQLGSGRVS